MSENKQTNKKSLVSHLLVGGSNSIESREMSTVERLLIYTVSLSQRVHYRRFHCISIRVALAFWDILKHLPMEWMQSLFVRIHLHDCLLI